MKVSLIVAAALNDTIGREGVMPWHLPADLKRFKSLTMGHHLVVGRKTFESIGRALPGRTMIVVSRQSGSIQPGVEVVGSPDEALELARGRGETELFVAGGGEIYRHFLDRADRVYLTRVEANVEGDAAFPALSADGWIRTECELHPADDRHAYPFRFEVWDST